MSANATQSSSDTATPDFEKALAELETLVSKMETGDLSLEESLKAFEQGVRLSRQCQTQLEQAEQRVKKLVEESDQLRSAAFREDTAEE